MTKRDVAIWFCKVWALTGMVGAAFLLLGNLLSWFVPLGLGSRLSGMSNLSYSIPHLALSGFLWLFAAGIGTELAVEGEHGPAIASVADLKPLLIRCAGLALLLSATVSLSLSLLQLGFFHFSRSTPGMAVFTRLYILNAIIYALQSLVGFLLAFTPRIRFFLGK